MALDVTVTPELEREGLGRDLVRHIQQMRKELDLELTDRIEVAYDTQDEVLLETLREHEKYIRAETLCDRLAAGKAEGGKEIKLSGHTVRLAVRKR